MAYSRVLTPPSGVVWLLAQLPPGCIRVHIFGIARLGVVVMCDSSRRVSRMLAVCGAPRQRIVKLRIARNTLRALVTSPTLMVFVAPLPLFSEGKRAYHSLPQAPIGYCVEVVNRVSTTPPT